MVLEPLRPPLGCRLVGEPLVDLLDALDREVVERLADRPDEREMAVAREEDDAIASRKILHRMCREEHRRARIGEPAQQPQQLA